MSEWLRKHALALMVIAITWASSIGYIKASTELRLENLEADVSEIKQVVHRLELTAIKLETITFRLERMANK